MPHHAGNLFAVEQLKKLNYQGKLSAIVQYSDDAASLRASGVHSVYNLYEAAGAGFVDHVVDELLSGSETKHTEAEAVDHKATLNAEATTQV